MLRYEELSEISDGKLYGPNDEVLTGTRGCSGCSKCCESDMGQSIELTPFDIYQMCRATGKSFDELLTSFLVEISMIDGIALPHLKMDKGCGFLANGRCTIHASRPVICRLFPLGRVYNEKGFDYFLQVHECPVPDKDAVVVSDWLGLDDLEANTVFTNKWHRFLIFERKKVAEIREFAANEVTRLREIPEDDARVYAKVVGDEEVLAEFEKEIEENIDKEDSEKVVLEKEDSKKSRFQETAVSKYVAFKCDALTQEAEDRIKEIMKTVLGYFYLDAYNEEDFYSQFDARLKKCLGAIRKL